MTRAGRERKRKSPRSSGERQGYDHGGDGKATSVRMQSSFSMVDMSHEALILMPLALCKVGLVFLSRVIPSKRTLHVNTFHRPRMHLGGTRHFTSARSLTSEFSN